LVGGTVAEELTLAPMRRLLSRKGGLRVSEGAAEELRRAMGEYGAMLAEAAVEHAKGEGRKTVLDRDIIAAEKQTRSKDGIE
jgi:histone H3/H4